MADLTRETIEEIKKYGTHIVGYEQRAETVIALCDLALKGLSGGGEAAQESVSVCEAYALELRRDAADMEARNVNPLQVNQLRAMASGVEVASSRIAAIRGYVEDAKK